MTIQKFIFLLIATLVAAVSFPCHAQYLGMAGGNAGVVQGRGNHVVKRMPDTVQLYLQVSAKGKTLEAALENLKKRTDAIRGQVATLGGKADTIKFTAPDKTDSTQQQQMLETLRRQMGGERVPKGLAMPQSVTVNTMFSAEWPVTADTAEKLLVEADKLQKKIVDADLAGVKAAEKEQTPEEREMAEEMESMMRNQYGGNQSMPKPGTPHLAYIARLSDADRDAATAEAFKKARADAERLAKAAGVQLGALAQVNSMSNAAESSASAMALAYRQAYNPYSQYGGDQWQPNAETDENESSSNTPGEVEFRFMVSVGYGVGEK